jgi:hypothetical protein
MTKQNRAPEPENQKEPYHFAGAGEYIPHTVLASSYEEALALWQEERVPVSLPSTPEAPEELPDSVIQ